MTISHIIYHIPGKKVGCTRDLAGRKLWYSKDIVIEVLEELHDRTDQEAGDIEWAWADKFSYKRGNHYTKVASVTMTPEARQQLARHRGRRDGGYQNLPREELLEIARKGGSRSFELKAGFHGFTHEQYVEAGRKSRGGSKGGLRTAALGKAGCQRRIQCPHCTMVGIIPNMHRWHFDNCPQKKESILR